MIKRAPLKSDHAGKCTRWKVRIWNAKRQKQEWHTVHGTRGEAEKIERKLKTQIGSGVYVSRVERRTVEQAKISFLEHLRARNRATSTIENYESALDCHILPKFGTHYIDRVTKGSCNEHLDEMRAKGCTVSQFNKALRAYKALMNYCCRNEWLDRNPLEKIKPLERVQGERAAKRGSFTEEEVRQLLAEADVTELALIGMLTFAGPRPGEVYALDCSCVDLIAGTVRIERAWDHRGKKFKAPKTKAGFRVLKLSPWLAEALRRQIALVGGKGLVFPAGQVGRPCDASAVCQQALTLYESGVDRGEIARRFASTPKRITQLICYARTKRQQRATEPARESVPLDPANVRRNIWLPLRKRAKVRDLDMYSLRHTFASLARTAGEEAFNVARAIGHSRSKIVDDVYAHGLPSGLATVSTSVTDRALAVAHPPAAAEAEPEPDAASADVVRAALERARKRS